MEHHRWHKLPDEPGADGPAWIEIEGWILTSEPWMIVVSVLHIIYGEALHTQQRPIWGWR